jgi:hypothetical protein
MSFRVQGVQGPDTRNGRDCSEIADLELGTISGDQDSARVELVMSPPQAMNVGKGAAQLARPLQDRGDADPA